MFVVDNIACGDASRSVWSAWPDLSILSDYCDWRFWKTLWHSVVCCLQADQKVQSKLQALVAKHMQVVRLAACETEAQQYLTPPSSPAVSRLA